MAKRAISPFAHLAGGVRAAADDTEDDKNKCCPSGEGEDTGEGEGGENPEDDAEKGKKGKKAKKAEDGTGGEGDDPDGTDDDDEDDDKDPKARAIRMRERGRCAAIFRSAAAGRNPAAAAELAFGTRLPRSEAIRVLRAIAPVSPEGQNATTQSSGYAALRGRMGVEGHGALPQPQGNSDDRPGSRMLKMANKRRGVGA